MLSKQAEFFKKILIASNQKNNFSIESVKARRKRFEKSVAAIKLLSKTLKVENRIIDGVKIISVEPEDNNFKYLIVYLHGGGFVNGLSAMHINYAGCLSKGCAAKVILVDYSLSPEVKYPTALNEVCRVWQAILDEAVDFSKIVLMGDSAGASLAISTMLKNRDNNIQQPACAILFSPSVDATLSEASYIYNDANDFILGRDIMEFFIGAYVADEQRHEPFVSSLRANLSKLPPFLLQVGSEEVLLDECREFVDNAKRVGVKADIKISDGLWHNYHLLADKAPESRDSIKTVVDYIADNC